MINPTDYIRPNSIEEAVRALENADAYPLCGGGLALGTLRFPYNTVVDLQDVPDLVNIYPVDDGITIGSGVMLQKIVDTPEIPLAFRKALLRTLPPNIRNNTSVLETFMVPNTPREWLAVLTAYDATITMMTFEGETVQFSFTESVLVAGKAAGRRLRDGLMLSIFVPGMEKGEAIGSAYVARTPADEPIVNVAVAVRQHTDGTVLGAFAAICGVSQYDGEAELLSMGELYRKPLTEENITMQANQVPHVIDPPSNYLGSAAYRKRMAHVLVKRALMDAAEQLSAQ